METSGDILVVRIPSERGTTMKRLGEYSVAEQNTIIDDIVKKAMKIVKASGVPTEQCVESVQLHEKCLQFITKRERVREYNGMMRSHAHGYPSWNEYGEGKTNEEDEMPLFYCVFMACINMWTLGKIPTVTAIDNVAAVIKHILSDSADSDSVTVRQFVIDLGVKAEMPFFPGKEYGSHFQTFPNYEVQNNFSANQRQWAFYMMLFFELHGNIRLRYARESECIRSSTFFRSLQYKAQVMHNNASDEQRTRLLHSLEVAGIAKTCASQLRCNWDLAEAIALGHDVGHVPFGHQGEEKLNTCLHKAWAGRFSHTLQSVKTLNFLETHTTLSDRFGLQGMCLSTSTLKGVLKHDTDGLLHDFRSAGFRLQYSDWCDCLLEDKEKQSGLIIGSMEAQIVYWADKIAYAGHDWEEMVQSNLLRDMCDALDKMMHRMNKIMHRNMLSEDLTTIKKSNELSGPEERLIADILAHMDDMMAKLQKGEYATNKENIKNDDETAVIRLMKAFGTELDTPLSKLIVRLELALEKNEAKSDEYIETFDYFTKTEYQRFHDFLNATAQWITVTGIYPKQYKKSDDALYILRRYLENISSRSIVRAFESHLVTKSMEAATSDVQDKRKAARESMQKLREEDRRLGYVDVKKTEMVKTLGMIKENFREKMSVAMTVTMDSKIVKAMRVTGKFIKDYYIGSPRVRIMQVKSHKIIDGLFNFFMEHEDMLPEEYYRRIELEMPLLLKDEPKPFFSYKIESIIHIYLLERRNEVNAQREGTDTSENRSAKLKDMVDDFVGDVDGEKYGIPKTVCDFMKKLKKEGYSKTATGDFYAELGRYIAKARVIADYIASMTDRMAAMKYDEISSSGTAWSYSYHE